MHHAIKVSKAAFAISSIAIAACGGSGSSSSAPSSVAAAASVKAAVAVAASASGTTIPAATQITDASADVWTVTAGVVSENGALAGYSQGVSLLLYDNQVLYQENAAGGWWSWNGSSWVSSSDPRKTPSPNGATIPGMGQITDNKGNVWTVSGGVIDVNGTLAGYSNGVAQLAYDNNVIYQENSAGGWWSWSGSTWVASSAPPKTTSPSGTVITSAGQITDSSGNVWTVSGGVIDVNGTLAGYSSGVAELTYDNNVIYQENGAGGWWSWTASTWASSSAPVNGNPAGPTIAGVPVVTDLVGEAYSFLPTTTNPGGTTLSFSITNMPAWGSFNSVTGELTGTPGNAQAGAYPNIAISVASGGKTATLAAFSITVTMGSAALSWTAPVNNTNGTALADLAGYTIYYGTSASSLTQTIQVANPAATSYVVSSLGSGTYYFAIAAYATDGTQSSESTTASKNII
jgi:hypothetical protein